VAAAAVAGGQGNIRRGGGALEIVVSYGAFGAEDGYLVEAILCAIAEAYGFWQWPPFALRYEIWNELRG